jgi:hypothetical protein
MHQVRHSTIRIVRYLREFLGDDGRDGAVSNLGRVVRNNETPTFGAMSRANVDSDWALALCFRFESEPPLMRNSDEVSLGSVVCAGSLPLPSKPFRRGNDGEDGRGFFPERIGDAYGGAFTGEFGTVDG